MYAQKNVLCVQYDSGPQSCQIYGNMTSFTADFGNVGGDDLAVSFNYPKISVQHGCSWFAGVVQLLSSYGDNVWVFDPAFSYGPVGQYDFEAYVQYTPSCQ